jgi:hypothetical protein
MLLNFRTVLLVCDLQERFAGVIQHFDGIVENTSRLGGIGPEAEFMNVQFC